MNLSQHIKHDGKVYSVALDYTDEETGAREFNIYAVINSEEVGQPLNVSGPSGSYPSKASAIREIKRGLWSSEHTEVAK